MTVTIYGASDDLIEVEGDIREEFSASPDDSEKPVYLCFSDGTVLSVLYDGMWRFNRVATGTATYDKREATDAEKDYSDRVTLTGDLRWCALGSELARAGK